MLTTPDNKLMEGQATCSSPFNFDHPQFFIDALTLNFPLEQRLLEIGRLHG